MSVKKLRPDPPSCGRIEFFPHELHFQLPKFGCFRNNPQIGNFLRTNVDVIENKVGNIGEIITDKIADLRGVNLDDVASAHH